MPHFARKKDRNHNSVRDALVLAGFVICETYRAPGCPDFFASKAGRTIAVEVKSRGGKLSEGQTSFARDWQGEYALLTDPTQVAELTEFGEKVSA